MIAIFYHENMIKLLIFDLDGVLFSNKDLHFHALNSALATIDQKYVISEQDHIKIFDGLSTNQKLIILNKERGFPLNRMKEVNVLKQEYTIPAIEQLLTRDQNLIDNIKQLSEKYTLLVASNSIRATIIKAVEVLGLSEYFTAILSNEDVSFPKPHCSIYLKAIYGAGVSPDETLILEDSPNGRKAAMDSGAHVYDVDHPREIVAKDIFKFIDNIKKKPQRWSAKNTLNILIPMGGRGKRFSTQGYQLPKPLIDVKGHPMIKWVIDSLRVDANFIFIVNQEHIDQYRIDYLLKSFVPGCQIVIDNPVLQGPATSCLAAKNLIDNSKHLFIANCDQYLEYDSSHFFYQNIVKQHDGSIITFKEKEGSNKWSFVRLDEHGLVDQIKEKQVISNLASTGHYYFDKGSDFVKYAERMITDNIRVNDEFYVSGVYDYMLKDNKKISNYTVDSFAGLGTPTDLIDFLKQDHKL